MHAHCQPVVSERSRPRWQLKAGPDDDHPTGPLWKNRLLGAMCRIAESDISPLLQPVVLPKGKFLTEPGRTIEHVYFPENSVVSLLANTGGKKCAEIALIGREGLVGLPALLGMPYSEFQTVVQVPGSAQRANAASLFGIMRTNLVLRDLLQKHTLALFTLASYNGACNALHNATQRAARWMLSMNDRAGTDFPLTQKFLAGVLGVRRATMNEVLKSLKDSGCIQPLRGRITISDPTRLEEASCDCYRKERRVRELILPGLLD